jgi:rhodanese-related sulfurtransferase
MQLPDEVAVWPTHGSGSFCSAPAGANRTSTIGEQRATNPLLRLNSEEQFVPALVGSLGSYPPYFDRLGAINRRGPELVAAEASLSLLDSDEVARFVEHGAVVVDVRPIADYAEAHVPGSISIELRDAFATWLGWLVPFGTTPVIVRDPSQDLGELVWQAAKIGFELRGELSGGIRAWKASGRPTASTVLARSTDLPALDALDIRQAAEYSAEHADGAANIELGDIPNRIAALPDTPYVVMCGHGERAMSAASLIERAGRPTPAVLLGGPAEWAAAHRLVLETG